MKTTTEKSLNNLAKSFGIRTKEGRKAFIGKRDAVRNLEAKHDQESRSISLREGAR